MNNETMSTAIQLTDAEMAATVGGDGGVVEFLILSVLFAMCWDSVGGTQGITNGIANAANSAAQSFNRGCEAQAAMYANGYWQ
jgi:hypothetical protein